MIFKLFTLVFSIGLPLLASCSSQLTSGQPGVKVSSRVSGAERAIAERIFNRVNAERARSGRRATQGNAGLNELAQKQANHLAVNGSNGHANTVGSGARAQFAQLRYNISNVTELANASSSSSPGLDTVNAWSNSPEHREIMLQAWNRMGVGVSKSADGNTYVTMLLGANVSGAPRFVNSGGF